MRDKVCGIVGGLGPEATIDLYKKILKTRQQRLIKIIFRW